MEAGKEWLTRNTVRDATRQEIDEIKRESTDLKHLVVDLSLEVFRLKETAIPPLSDNGDGAYSLPLTISTLFDDTPIKNALQIKTGIWL